MATLDDLVQWLKHPFSQDQSAVGWFAFIGLLLVSLYLWHTIARDWQRLAD